MGTNITLTAGDGFRFGAYRAEPESAPKGGIVVIQEIFGVNSHIREVADGYAAAGYLAIAPALYDRVEAGVEVGYTEADIAAGRDYRGRTDHDKVLADVTAAAGAARAGGRVGAVGYCWGGFLAAAAAVDLHGAVDACVGYYGGGIANALLDRSPQVPLMLHFGEIDHAIPLEDVDKIRAAWPDVPVHVYGGAGHGFECDQRASYHPHSARLALSRTLRFFATHVG
ncbi:MAG: dienelactone hydrolase family protein [Acidimicrobiia bacterium]|nr:dienelactone hydrolase family protein [Acidimicrobiia bacterium]